MLLFLNIEVIQLYDSKIQVGELRVHTAKSIHVGSVRSKDKKGFKNPLQNFITSIRTVNNNVLISIALKLVLTLISKFKTRKFERRNGLPPQGL